VKIISRSELAVAGRLLREDPAAREVVAVEPLVPTAPKVPVCDGDATGSGRVSSGEVVDGIEGDGVVDGAAAGGATVEGAALLGSGVV
jgi:hypothetical protein